MIVCARAQSSEQGPVKFVWKLFVLDCSTYDKGQHEKKVNEKS